MGYYEAGHMMYVNQPSLAALKQDLAAFHPLCLAAEITKRFVRLLDRYLLRELLVPLAYCLGGFLIFYVAFDLIFQINRFQEGHLLFLDVVEYYVVTLPEMLADQVIPVSLLLACLYALTNHSRHNELTAMRAAGVSLWRLSLPYLGVGIWRPGCFGPERTVGAAGRRQIQGHLWNAARSPARTTTGPAAGLPQRSRPAPLEHRPIQQSHFRNDRAHRHLGIARRLEPLRFSPKAAFIPTANGAFTASKDGTGRRANPFPSRPRTVCWTHRFPKHPPRSERKSKSVPSAPTEAAKGPQLSIHELLTYLRWHPHMDRQKRWPSLMTQLQGRIAAPFTCLAVVLIALPFGARSGRHNVFVGVAGSIFICFAYFILQRISSGLGVAGYLPPFVAAWLPNILFGGAGIVLISRVPMAII